MPWQARYPNIYLWLHIKPFTSVELAFRYRFTKSPSQHAFLEVSRRQARNHPKVSSVRSKSKSKRKTIMGEVMDRGSAALKSTLENCATLEVRHARRGVLQEWLCCITKSSFKYYEGEKKIAQSKEKFNFFHRCLLAPIHPFGMTIKEAGTGEELIDVDRSGRCCLACGKCCCFQDAVIYSGGKDLGEISETCWCL